MADAIDRLSQFTGNVVGAHNRYLEVTEEFADAFDAPLQLAGHHLAHAEELYSQLEFRKISSARNHTFLNLLNEELLNTLAAYDSIDTKTQLLKQQRDDAATALGEAIRSMKVFLNEIKACTDHATPLAVNRVDKNDTSKA